MAKFVFIIREDLSKYPRPEEVTEAIIQKHIQWAGELVSKGVFKDGNGIGPVGNLIEMKNGEIQVGPIRDVEEGVGGYYIIEAENLRIATEIAKTCPTYSDGDLLEVRPIGE